MSRPSKAQTSTDRPGSASRYSSTWAASFFVRRLLLGARRLGVPWPGQPGAVAELAQVVPPALRPHFAAEPGRHPRRHLGAGPQPAIGRRPGQRVPRRRLVLGAEERPRAGVPAPPVAQTLGAVLVVAAHDRGHPAPAVAGDLRDLRDPGSAAGRSGGATVPPGTGPPSNAGPA